MIEARRIVGLKIKREDLKKVCETPLSKLESIAKKVAKVCEAERVYLFGGALRNIIWLHLHKHIPDKKVDADLLVVTPMAFGSAITALGKMKEFSPLLIVSDDTVRADLGDGAFCDIKLTPSVRYATIDFSINAVFAPLDGILGARGADVYCASLEDLDNMVLRHLTPFEVYPFHMVRGIRLASVYGLKIAPRTLNEYKRKAKYVLNVSAPLIHRELAEAVNEGYERAVWFAAITNIINELYPMLKNYAKKHPDDYTNLINAAYRIVAAFNPENKVKQVLSLVPPRLLKKNFAPGGRNILYCYFTAAFLLPFKLSDILKRLHELNFYPAERGIIAMCVESAQQRLSMEKAPPLAVPFLAALEATFGAQKR